MYPDLSERIRHFFGIASIAAWIWKEHKSAFGIFYTFSFQPPKEVLALLVPLLALPQITHYIIDGYIWKVSRGHIPFKRS